jgi:hypothetical protein
VSVGSPDTLAANRWYFVAGTMERTSPRTQTMRLYVNGVAVAEEKTSETVNYDTTGMWTTIGPVDMGTWQNLDGQIDDVRICDRALSPAEVAALYGQAWKRSLENCHPELVEGSHSSMGGGARAQSCDGLAPRRRCPRKLEVLRQAQDDSCFCSRRTRADSR